MNQSRSILLDETRRQVFDSVASLAGGGSSSTVVRTAAQVLSTPSFNLSLPIGETIHHTRLMPGVNCRQLHLCRVLPCEFATHRIIRDGMHQASARVWRRCHDGAELALKPFPDDR